MTRTIKLKDARDLIHQNKGKFVYVDQVDNDPYVEIIFRAKGYTPLYSFWYYISDVPDLGMTIDTVQQFDAFLDDSDNNDFDVEVAPVKKILVTTYRYVGDDSND